MESSTNLERKYEFLGPRDPQTFTDQILNGLFDQIKNRKRKTSSSEDFEKIDKTLKRVSDVLHGIAECKQLAEYFSLSVQSYDVTIRSLRLLETIVEEKRSTKKEIYSSPAQFLIKLLKNPKPVSKRYSGEKAWTEHIISEWKRMALIGTETSKDELERLKNSLNDKHRHTMQNISKGRIKKPRKQKI